jgi:hypothetical protein
MLNSPDLLAVPLLKPSPQTALKAIIGKLMKAPEAEYFLYPVDARYDL